MTIERFKLEPHDRTNPLWLRIEALDKRFPRQGNAGIERIATGFRWAEGPAYFPAMRCLIWSDIPNNRMLRWSESTRDGTLSDLDFQPQMKVWLQVCSEAHLCTARNCGPRGNCFFQEARKAAAAIPGSRLIEYDGAPHGLLATHKDQLAQDVLAFLATNYFATGRAPLRSSA